MFPPVLNLSDLDGTTGFRLNSVDVVNSFRNSVAIAGDVNGDGIDDVIIGAPSNRSDRAGAADVLFGSSEGFPANLSLATLDGSNGFRLTGVDPLDEIGLSVAGAGDINGDGIDDMILGAPSADPNGVEDAGVSYVVFGSSSGFPANLSLASLDGSNGFRLEGINVRNDAGRAVAGAGDVNGDGIDDIILGAPGASPNGISSAGVSYVVFGSSAGFPSSLSLASLDGSNGFRVEGRSLYDLIGRAVAGAGDVNADGIKDLIVGSSARFAGESYVIFGSSTPFPASISTADLDGANGFRLDGESRDDAGYSVAGGGDINGDGVADLIVGAPGDDGDGDPLAGRTYVVFGSSAGFPATVVLSDLDGTDGFRITGINKYDGIGISVAVAGDVNGDGIDDVVGGTTDVSDIGAGYVVFGTDRGLPASLSIAELDGINGFRIDGTNSATTVAGNGDINGDGIDDFIMSIPFPLPSYPRQPGLTYVVFGVESSEDCVVENAARPSETFTFTGGRLQINGFDTDESDEKTSDTLVIDAAGFEASINTVEELFAFIDVIEFDGDGSTDAIYTDNDIAFVLSRNPDGTVKDGVVLMDVIGRDGITLEALAEAGADVFGKFPDKEDDSFCELDRIEVPGDASSPFRLDIVGEVRNRVDFADDQNWFRVDLQMGELYRFDLVGDATFDDPLQDPYFYLFSESGDLIAQNDDASGTLNSRLFYVASQDGPAFAAAASYGSSTGDYILSVENVPIADDIPGDTSSREELVEGAEVRSRVDFPGDQDWFRVTLDAGDTYQFDLRRNNGSRDPLVDPLLYLYDEDGELLDANDDFAYLESRLFYTASEDQIVYAGAAGYSDSVGEYVLSLENITVSDTIPGDISTNERLTVGEEVRNTIDFPRDDDWFQVALEGGGTYQFDLLGDNDAPQPLIDPFLSIYDSDGVLIDFNDDYDGLNSRLIYSPADDEIVFASAMAFSSGTGAYILRLSEEMNFNLLADVPAYSWYHGCGPTAAGSIVGYWDQQGFPGLFDAVTLDDVLLTANVRDHISSPAHNAKYDPTPDNPNLPVPPTTSLAGFMGTSVDPLRYGWTFVSRIDDGLEGYSEFRGYDFQSLLYRNADDGTVGGSQWERFTEEIDAGRPVQLTVDTGFDGTVDHFVPAIGYEDRGADGLWYAAYTTWSESETPIWREFRPVEPNSPWSVGYLNTFAPGAEGSSAPIADVASLEGLIVPSDGSLEKVMKALSSDGDFDEVDAKIVAQAKDMEPGPVVDDLLFA